MCIFQAVVDDFCVAVADSLVQQTMMNCSDATNRKESTQFAQLLMAEYVFKSKKRSYVT